MRTARTASQIEAEQRQRAMVAEWYRIEWLNQGRVVEPVSKREAEHYARRARQRFETVEITRHVGPEDLEGVVVQM